MPPSESENVHSSSHMGNADVINYAGALATTPIPRISSTTDATCGAFGDSTLASCRREIETAPLSLAAGVASSAAVKGVGRSNCSDF